jgi:hypothetical protein
MSAQTVAKRPGKAQDAPKGVSGPRIAPQAEINLGASLRRLFISRRKEKAA